MYEESLLLAPGNLLTETKGRMALCHIVFQLPGGREKGGRTHLTVTLDHRPVLFVKISTMAMMSTALMLKESVSRKGKPLAMAKSPGVERGIEFTVFFVL
jgi:hypothetical protein